MTANFEERNDLHLDTRVRNRNLRKGILTREAIAAQLAALPDRGTKAAWIALDPLMAEAEAVAEQRRAALWAEPKREDEVEDDDE